MNYFIKLTGQKKKKLTAKNNNSSALKSHAKAACLKSLLKVQQFSAVRSFREKKKTNSKKPR